MKRSSWQAPRSRTPAGHVARVLASLAAWLVVWLGTWPSAWATAPTAREAVASASAPAGSDADDDAAPDYWDDKNRGWFFYERKAKKPPPPVPAPAPVVTPAATPPAAAASAPRHPDLVRFEALQKRVEESRNIAIVNPTEANLQRYLSAQKEALDTASRFGELTKRVLWANPQFDPTVTDGRPIAATGQSLYEAEDGRRQQRNWQALSQTHALFYFFRSDCPYCARFSPILKAFSERSGIHVLPISLDGQGTRHFPQFKVDNGIATRLDVQQVPALFLAEPKAGKILPVGYGVLSPIDLERRIDLITRPDIEAATPQATRHLDAIELR